MTTQRDEFVERMKKQLDDINAQLTEYEKQADEAGEKARADYDAQIDKLREQGKKMQVKLEELRGASEDSWDRMMEETRKIRDAFIHSLNYFRSQLK
jgi:chromosome segregation ATPase